MARVGACGDRLHQPGEQGLERLLRGRRAERARLARTPAADVPRRRLGVGEAQALELAAQNVGVIRELPALAGGEAVEDLPGALDMRPKDLKQRAAVFEAVQMATLSS